MLALGILAAVVLGPPLWGVLTDKHTEGTWQVTSAPDELLVGIEVTVRNGRVSAQGPCNSLGGDWSQDEGLVSNAGGTLVGCESEKEQADDELIRLLGPLDSVEVDDDVMTLEGGAGTLVLTRIDG